MVSHGWPYTENSPLDRLRLKLVAEEFAENCVSETSDNLLTELTYLVYIIYGYADTYGWDLEEAVCQVMLQICPYWMMTESLS